jgi:hypothetical protein
MQRVYSPRNEAELAVLRSLFDARGVHYFVHNDALGSFLAGPQIDNFNVKSIVVPDECVARARELVAEFNGAKGSEPTRATFGDRLRMVAEFNGAKGSEPARASFVDRLRMVAEALLFSWFVPGHRSGRPGVPPPGEPHLDG